MRSRVCAIRLRRVVRPELQVGRVNHFIQARPVLGQAIDRKRSAEVSGRGFEDQIDLPGGGGFPDNVDGFEQPRLVKPPNASANGLAVHCGRRASARSKRRRRGRSHGRAVQLDPGHNSRRQLLQRRRAKWAADWRLARAAYSDPGQRVARQRADRNTKSLMVDEAPASKETLLSIRPVVPH